MSIKLTNNFFLNSRGIEFLDGGGVVWTFDKNANAITATVTPGVPSGANPTAVIGLTAVNGTAATFMRSDGAPALSQAIAPTWSGLHTFGAGLTISAGAFTLNTHTLTLTANASVSGTNTGDQIVPTGANPSAGVGLAVVNGTATTFMRSDGAPALSQAIVPTWSGLHTFGAGLTVSAGSFTLNSHTLTLTATASVEGTNTGDQTVPVGANPSASVGLAVVNGTAATWMRSDGAPALSQAIAPTWTGLHTFSPGSGVAVIINGVSGTNPVQLKSGNTNVQATDYIISRTSSVANTIVNGPSMSFFDTGANTQSVIQHSGGQLEFWNNTGTWAQVMKFTTAGLPVFGQPTSTGWGTPTGGTVVASFAAGATPSLLQMSEAVAQIITVLKQFGLFGA